MYALQCTTRSTLAKVSYNTAPRQWFSGQTSAWKDLSHVKSVGVIGGGVAGLQVAKSLKARGFDVTVFEQAPAVGGVWRSNYSGFGIQVPKELYEFSDFPFTAASSGEFASGPKIQDYIGSYVSAHSLGPAIRTSTSVQSVAPRSNGERGWTFTVKDATGSVSTPSFDFCVNATGMYHRPNVPAIPGQETFKGQVLHSTEFMDAAQAKGKRVVVVGSAKSAIDCSVEAKRGGAVSSTLLARNAHWGTPRNIAGLIPFKYVFLSRFGQALVSWYKGALPTAPSSVHGAHSALKTIMGPVFGIVEALFAFQLGLKGPMTPNKDTDVVKDFYGYAHVLDSSFKEAVSNKDVNVVRGRVARFVPEGVVLEEGKTLPADLVVFGTGFKKSYSWLDNGVVKVLGPQEDGLWLYRHVIHPEVPDLAFVGSEVATISNISTYGIQAEWLASLLKGKTTLPQPEAMKEAIAAHQSWARSWMHPTPCRASLVLLHQTHYHDTLLKDMGIQHRRKGANVLAEIFAPYEPRDYAGVAKAAGSN